MFAASINSALGRAGLLLMLAASVFGALAVLYGIRQRDRKLLKVNCAAFNDNLLESEMFGHVKGAFTGAVADRRGTFESADGGTLFLDEIGDMSLKAQSKTLRILQEQKFERVGGSRTIRVDVRVIAATNKDLEAEIEKGRFRDDLYFRLNVIPIRVPPLRERTADIPALVKEFLKEMALNTNTAPKEFSEGAIQVLKRYHWPGNIRELRNLVERLVIMTQAKEVQVEDIPAPFSKEAAAETALTSTLKASTFKEAKESFEKAFIASKLQEFKWNVSQTADAIGIERSNLHKKIKAYGLDSLRPSSS